MIQFTCAWPIAELWQNSRAHWSVKNRAVAMAKHEARTLAIRAGAKTIGDGKAYRVTITFKPGSRSRADRQNMPGAVKAHIDGIAHALGVDDRCFYPVFQYAERGGPGAVEFVVERTEP
jgi:crossover junction endodeoxyribonuclease RusA